MKNRGLIHIYCGDGKGKTTAAAGLAIRCAGGGGKVLFYQFLKDGTSGEINVLKSLDNVEVVDGYRSSKFSFNMTDEEKRLAAEGYEKDFEYIANRVSKKHFDVLVLDEILHGINLKYLSLERVLEFLINKPEGLEVIMTGRNPDKKLIDISDYVSEIVKVKHPFDKGIVARKYIEL